MKDMYRGPINPVAFELFGIPVMWYGILITIGMVLGGYIAIQTAKKYNITEETMLDFLIWVLPISIIGARIYYVIFSWEDYQGDFLKMINIRLGGLAIYGGIIAGVITALIFTKKRNINFWQFTDIAAPSIALGQAIGRWGNFINGEAHGMVTDLPWAITVAGEKVHPTFLYESICDFGIFLFLHFMFREKISKNDGETFAMYLVLYGAARAFIEGMRTDSLYIGAFRVSQLLSVGIAILGLAYIIVRRVMYKKASQHN